MPMTMTQKILARHANQKEVYAGQLVKAKLDFMFGNDITAPVAIDKFKAINFKKLFDADKVAFVMDHFVPNKDIKSAMQCKKSRLFAKEFGIKNFFDVGQMGIEHIFLPEQGFIAPGEVIIGADSHTCTYGALNAFSTGVGSTDLGAALAVGYAWFKVPSAIKINITGSKKKFVTGKDIILTLIGQIGVDGALYKSLEYFGEGLKELNMADRFTISNMAIEAGAKNGIFPTDEITLEYLKYRVDREYETFSADVDAKYERVIDLNLDDIDCVVAYPHLPSNTKSARDGENISIDQVVIGSCTNGKIEDMAMAAKILKGRHLADGVRGIIIPATMEIYRECIKRGYTEIFLDAGCIISTPTCGCCLGGYMGILASGERCISTTNRNFVGRMGHVDSEVYLASPYVAAASGITGHITHPEKIF